MEYFTESEKQNGCKCVGCLPSWLHGWLGAAARCHCPATWKNIVPHMASLGKDQNSKHTISTECVLLSNHHKIKKSKSNHRKSGTVCSWTLEY